MAGDPRSSRTLTLLVAVIALLAAFFAGVLTERLRFDFQRTDMLTRYDRALRQHQEQIIESEQRAREPAPNGRVTR